MSEKLNLNPLANANASFYVRIVLGSSVRDSPIVSCALAKKDGIDLGRTAAHLFFDWEKQLHCHVDGELDHKIVDAFGPEDFVEAIPPLDQEALKKAEDAGDLYPAGEGWYLNPGAIAELSGATGMPPYGLLLALVNSRLIEGALNRIFQEARSHARQDQRVLEGMEEVPIRVRVDLSFVTPGGMGFGAACWLIGGGIRSCAKDSGVQANITLHAICRGSLPTKDDEKANLNESIALRHLQVLASGTYVSPLTGQKHPTVDSLFVSSNENRSGDLTSLSQLIIQQGYDTHFFYHSNAGARMRAAMVDILDQEPDEHGDPRPGLTMECASLSRDSDRLLGSCKYRAAAILAEAIRAPSDPDKVQQEAIDLARQLKIVESDNENLLTATLSHLSEFGGEDVAERAKSSFQDRTAGCRGLEGAIVVEESLQAIVNGDIPQVYESLIRKQAQDQARVAKDALYAYQQQAMKSADGLSRCRSVLALVKLIGQQSAESLMAKERELRELERPHEQIVAEASEQISRLRQRRWPARITSHFLIQRLCTALRESGMSLISYLLQIAPCEIGVAEFLTPIIEQLDSQCAWLSGMDHKLIQIGQICATKADSIVAKPTITKPQLGIELVTAEYAKAYFDDFVCLHGGQDSFSDYILHQFLQKYSSLAVLADAPLDEYEENFATVGADIFHPQIQSENVMSEFKRVYPDQTMQRKIIGRLVRQSEGSIRTTGESNEPITWIKTANAPTTEAAEWLRGVLGRVDKKQGVWDIAVTGNRDRIDLGQLRGGISLQSLIERIAIPDDPSGWAKLITHAPDPCSVLIVPPNPSPRQFKRVLAKAIANNQLTVSQNGRYILNSSSGEQLDIGSDPQSVWAFLQPKWRELVFVESTFGRNLIVAEGEIMSALKDLKAQIQSADAASDPRLQLIDLTAVEECLVQAELMLPRLRRMRKAIRKKVTS